MQFTVVYSDGVWSFKVSSLEDEPDYLEEFEITKLEEAQNIADELIAEIMEMTDDIFDDVEQMDFLTNNQKQQYVQVSPQLAKEEAIEEFTEMVNLDRKVAAVISKVLARSPSAILIAWEEEGAVKATTIPFSTCLVKGMVDTLFDMVFGDDNDTEEPDDPS